MLDQECGERCIRLAVPDAFPCDAEILLSHWGASGDGFVEQRALVATFEGVKASVDVLAPSSGMLRRIGKSDLYRSGEIFAVIDAPEQLGTGPGQELVNSHLPPGDEIPISQYGKRLASALAKHNSAAAVSRVRMQFSEPLVSAAANSRKSDFVLSVPEYIAWHVTQIAPAFATINSKLTADRWTTFEQVNLGYVVDLGNSMMVPVILGASKMAIDEFFLAMRQLVLDAARCELIPRQCYNGTITVSNLYSTGVRSFDPILNVGQSATIGIAAAIGGELEVSLAYDHRVVAGRTAADFLNALRQQCEMKCDSH
ncbi:2-oxo acid dehydrogenase subunit E2 [Roseiconus lacunae]|uniref:2-oxo acid dehydrogenase subunit E2 n=1 Tax=Roseiconus lacunae TaxID=2605694 RepID=UPI001E31A1F4|nr:2-oxo acid dehydrogenase subunit E2 [Roseiconus lacunae]MCD0458161.1 2-oxo acid dehydrogenase subunit E2 [Roseiconus lacunae]